MPCIHGRVVSEDGREVMIDVEGMEKSDIGDLIQRTLGKTPLVRKREHLEAMKKSNPAEFGELCITLGTHQVQY